jgi:hypothetical protein
MQLNLTWKNFGEIMTRRTGKAGSNENNENAENKTNFQQSVESVGNTIRNDLVTNFSTPMGLGMADVVYAEALRIMGEALKSGHTGPLTQQMLTSLSAGITNPLDNWKTEIETWYQPVALLPSSSES